MDFSAVYYSSPVPTSLSSLALLSLIFDKLIFPGVHMPSTGVDVEATLKEINRIRGLGKPGADDVDLLNCMVYAVNMKHISEFCTFTAQPNEFGELLPGAKELMAALDEQVYGPPRDGFIPIPVAGHLKSLPGDGDPAVIYPSWLGYPANAYVYARAQGHVLINDNPALPVLGFGAATMKGDATALATVLALESARMVLPSIKPVTFEEIGQFRAETNDLAKAFRREMIRMSRDLNAMIQSETPLADIRKEARFLVDTTVGPALEELRAQISKPSRPWYKRIVSVAKDLPELIASFATLPPNLVVAKVLAKVCEVLADVRDEQLEAEGKAKRCAFHYLLRVERFRG